MSVRDCLDKLVKQGKFTRSQAARADALWRRYQNKFSLDMPAAQADAAAALQAAREIMQSSRQKKNAVALQVKRQTAAEQSQMAHPWGPAAGGMAVLTRDIYRLGGENVDTRAQTLREILFSKFNAGIEAYKSSLAGIKQDTAGVRNLVAELFGVDSGDAIAKAAAKGWKDATEWGAKFVQSAGKIFEENENWRLPQFWSADRVRRFGMGDEFKQDVLNAIETGGLQIFDKERLEFAQNTARIGELVDKAARDIITEAGGAPAFSKEMRTFHFADGKAGLDAFMALQDKYGSGQDILATLTGHLGAMAREGALVDMLGPQHASTVAILEKNARTWENTGKQGRSKFQPARMLGMESAAAIERTYSVLSGRANGVENAAWGGFMGSLRSLMAASSLGTATVSATIGDSVTTLLASRYNGLEGGKVLGRAIETIFAENPKMKEDAARLLVTGHAMSDHAIGTLRYTDQMFTPELVRKLADGVIRLSGLTAWTEGVKKAFTMEFLGFIARNADTGYAGLEEPFRAFLDRYRISAKEWDRLRAIPMTEVHGAKFFDSSRAMSDDGVRRLYEGVLQERAMAVLEPDARVRGFTTQGNRAGSFMGEVSRSLTMFQSFSMTMVMTHMMALAVKDGVSGNRALNNALFYSAHILAGAAIVQSRQMLQGKDPIDMHHAKFWWQAAAQGGGAGYFGDLISGVTGAADRSVAGKFSGPIGGFIDDASQFGNAIVNRQPSAAGKGIELVKHITPGSNLWFSRLATDRLIFDQLHRALDPDYLNGFSRRAQRAYKEYGQQYWFPQGETTPARAPALGAAIGIQQ
ncbi:hypothetical protein [Afipia felis]|uniref:Uncharacterized protein n=3 Tax=Afipia felis TaxID=1035 RepID=A0A380W5L9_AFIFE|nr:hypothetical protein [Afipia felis]EKS26733.1 hypothetical protein HMPREF9697_03991 [Afipia felis ATCC 53690]SUU76174.1 Uncharacterised protein [Afipia felis]SUU84241.1 Uncharacterised protein [Afipia felis]